jgi:hypothetical protein
MKKIRVKAFFIDYLVISLYLILLLLINLLLGSIFNWTYDISHFQAQLVATLFSVLPISLIFGIIEGKKGYTLGKYLMKIQVSSDDKKLARSVYRNILKFLPWQLGHMATIYGIFKGIDSIFYILLILSFSLLIIYVFTFTFFSKPIIDLVTKVDVTSKTID